jgi:hypothetical protein
MTANSNESRLKLRDAKNAKNTQNLNVDAASAKEDPDGQYLHKTTPVASALVRNDRDLRSPGHDQTPIHVVAAAASTTAAALPDFITQTDRFGNASTPRSGDAISNARQSHPAGAKPHLHVGKDGKLHEDSEDDDDPAASKQQGPIEACTETLLDSLRLMCCCLAPDIGGQPRVVKSQATAEEEFEPDENDDRPKLLPKLHPDDHGKPCLVLDLDETLVHSSFRAVPGADFVIPVQVCAMLDLCGSSLVCVAY